LVNKQSDKLFSNVSERLKIKKAMEECCNPAVALALCFLKSEFYIDGKPYHASKRFGDGLHHFVKIENFIIDITILQFLPDDTNKSDEDQ
jgi:hypothetical protein